MTPPKNTTLLAAQERLRQMTAPVAWRGRLVWILASTYPVTRRLRLDFYDDDPAVGRVATATVHVPCCPLTANQVLVNDQGENQGMLQLLVEAGLVQPTGWKFEVGPAEAHICDLLI